MWTVQSRSKTSANHKEELQLTAAEQLVVLGNPVITFIFGHSCSRRLTVAKQFLCCCCCQVILWGFQATKLHSLNWELGRERHAATLNSNKIATQLVSWGKVSLPMTLPANPPSTVSSAVWSTCSPNQQPYWYSTLWGVLCQIPVKSDRFLEKTT